MSPNDTRPMQTAAEIRAERDFISTVLDVVGALVVVLDREGRIELFNRACERATGYQAEEVMHQPFWGIFLLSEEATEVHRVFIKLRAGDFPLSHENYWRTKDGNRRLIAWSNSCIAGPDGMVQHVIGTGIDITERRKAEEEVRRLNTDLERRVAERTAALETTRTRLEESNRELEQFAYVASHDLQEPLRKISAFGNLLSRGLGLQLSGEPRDYLDRMLNAVQRMQTLINDLLSLSRVSTQAKPFEPTDLNRVLREVLADFDTRIETTRARLDAGPLPTLDADPVQMHQLFQNLIGNAIKFHKPDEAPAIRISAGAADESGFVEITVEDQGIGFDEKYADRIFGVFQRLHTRTEYEGSGIGLAICRKIAQRHGGEIAARSTPGRGSTFKVRLPLRQTDATHPAGECPTGD